jgi:hypothetical protein
MSVFTAAEQQTYAEMQARLIALLLRHDAPSFRRFVDLRSEFDQEQDADALQHYRELAVLFHLRDEFFEDILPRIVRRLSFEAPRTMLIEEPPVSGRIDWERTLAATWTDRPGEVPLLLHTRQRRRDFATPENLLAVVTLIEYRDDIQRLLWDEYAAVGLEALRHPLGEIVDQCERELAFPQFSGLQQVAQRIIQGEQGGLDALEEQVQLRLLPGGNTAYEDLLRWRQRRRALRLLERVPVSQHDDVLGADPDRDNYLYQFWIFFELADLLHEQERLTSLETSRGSMCLRFRWGVEDATCAYELRHDQSVPEPIVRWRTVGASGAMPGVRPDFYLRRINPPVERVEQHGTVFWREPGVVWDAKYYRERESASAPSTPVKRMIADLTLLGKPHGVLLFAFLGKQATSSDTDTSVLEPIPVNEHESTGTYKLAPTPTLDQTLGVGPSVVNVQLHPGSNTSKTRKVLTSLLNQAYERMQQPRVPTCHGIFLDTLSVAEQSVLVDRYGTPIDDDPEELLLCPKPHIGPWHIDLVSRQRHCCQDGAFCQIIERSGATKPVRPPRSAEDLLEELQHIFTQSEHLDEASVRMVARQVESDA